MSEIWKDVVGYEDLFMISSKGNVFSKRSNKMLKQTLHVNGYYIFSTRIGGRAGKAVCFKVHRLVAQAFISNPENKRTVNHIDGCKTNNNLSNLEWATHKENSKHAIENNLIIPRKSFDNASSKLTEEDVLHIRNRYKPYCRQNGSRALSREFGVGHPRILDVVNNKSYK